MLLSKTNTQLVYIYTISLIVVFIFVFYIEYIHYSSTSYVSVQDTGHCTEVYHTHTGRYYVGPDKWESEYGFNYQNAPYKLQFSDYRIDAYDSDSKQLVDRSTQLRSTMNSTDISHNLVFLSHYRDAYISGLLLSLTACANDVFNIPNREAGVVYSSHEVGADAVGYSKSDGVMTLFFHNTSSMNISGSADIDIVSLTLAVYINSRGSEVLRNFKTLESKLLPFESLVYNGDEYSCRLVVNPDYPRMSPIFCVTNFDSTNVYCFLLSRGLPTLPIISHSSETCLRCSQSRENSTCSKFDFTTSVLRVRDHSYDNSGVINFSNSTEPYHDLKAHLAGALHIVHGVYGGYSDSVREAALRSVKNHSDPDGLVTTSVSELGNGELQYVRQHESGFDLRIVSPNGLSVDRGHCNDLIPSISALSTPLPHSVAPDLYECDHEEYETVLVGVGHAIAITTGVAIVLALIYMCCITCMCNNPQSTETNGDGNSPPLLPSSDDKSADDDSIYGGSSGDEGVLNYRREKQRKAELAALKTASNDANVSHSNVSYKPLSGGVLIPNGTGVLSMEGIEMLSAEGHDLTTPTAQGTQQESSAVHSSGPVHISVEDADYTEMSEAASLSPPSDRTNQEDHQRELLFSAAAVGSPVHIRVEGTSTTDISRDESETSNVLPLENSTMNDGDVFLSFSDSDDQNVYDCNALERSESFKQLDNSFNSVDGLPHDWDRSLLSLTPSQNHRTTVRRSQTTHVQLNSGQGDSTDSDEDVSVPVRVLVSRGYTL